MQLKMRKATEDERDSILRTLEWCEGHNVKLDGLPYDDQLAGPGGIHLNLLVSPGTSKERIEAALKQGYRERDVVYHTVTEVPEAWFEAAGVSLP